VATVKIRVGVVLAVAALLVACVGQGQAVDPDSPSRAQPDVPRVAVPAPPDALPDALSEVVLSDGFSPHVHLGRTDGMLNWPPADQMPQGIGDPPVPAGLGPLTIQAMIDRFPISCVQHRRTIVQVDVGPGEPAARIAAEIVRVAVDEASRFSGWFGVEEDCAGLVPGSPSSIGDSYQELAEEPCEIPSGPPVRCFVLADFGYPPGAAHTYLHHHQLVFDTASGERLTLQMLFEAGGLDPEAAFDAAVDLVSSVTGKREPIVRQARPTAGGLVFGFSPYEAGSFPEYTRDVLIPWALLPRVDAT